MERFRVRPSRFAREPLNPKPTSVHRPLDLLSLSDTRRPLPFPFSASPCLRVPSSPRYAISPSSFRLCPPDWPTLDWLTGRLSPHFPYISGLPQHACRSMKGRGNPQTIKNRIRAHIPADASAECLHIRLFGHPVAIYSVGKCSRSS